MTGAEPACDWDPVAELTGGGGLKLGKPVGGVDEPSCSAGWGPEGAACCGPDWGEAWALNPPLDVVGIALRVAAWLAP